MEASRSQYKLWVWGGMLTKSLAVAEGEKEKEMNTKTERTCAR